VLSHEVPVKAGPNVDLTDAQKSSRNRTVSAKTVCGFVVPRIEQGRHPGEKFEEAMKKAKDTPATKPIRDFDLD